jgi:hypothetical protein
MLSGSNPSFKGIRTSFANTSASIKADAAQGLRWLQKRRNQLRSQKRNKFYFFKYFYFNIKNYRRIFLKCLFEIFSHYLSKVI